MPNHTKNHRIKKNTTKSSDGLAKPTSFLKWPGGKTWLADRLATCITSQLHGVYYEPFLGSGAVFFALQSKNAVLSDINEDLVNVYQQVQTDYCELIKRLKTLPVSSKRYYLLRDDMPSDPTERAVRFLYLNRTAFGGIYRLNMEGRFNVPYGGGKRTPEILWRKNLLKKASSTLTGIKLFSRDFDVSMQKAKPGDVIYCDPTYTVSHENNAFCRYNERNFSWADQIRLAAESKAAAKRGVSVIVTNACHKCIRDLYSPHQPLVVNRFSCVSRKTEARRPVREYIFALGPWPRLWRCHFR